MSAWNKVVIVGVGLLGGSVGLGLRKRELAKEIVGFDRDPVVLRQAQDCGAIDSASTSLAKAVAGAELVILCTPIEFIPETAIAVLSVAEFRGYVTDVGSTKNSIVGQMSQALAQQDVTQRKVCDPNALPRFVGSHPLAGGERSGPQHADADLFSGCTTILVPLDESSPKTIQAIDHLWKSLGANTRTLDPKTHDRVMASVSHLPHLVASALAASTQLDELAFAASGWRDSTRIAAGDANLWASILLDNRDNLLAGIERFEAQISLLKTALIERDRDALLQLLQTGKNHRDSLGS